MPDCYACRYRVDGAPGWSQCRHPATDGLHDGPLARLTAYLQRVSRGRVLRPVTAAEAALHVAAHADGIARGAFVWPLAFDPRALTACDGFTESRR